MHNCQHGKGGMGSTKFMCIRLLNRYFYPAVIFQAGIFSPRQVPVLKNGQYQSYNLSKILMELQGIVTFNS